MSEYGARQDRDARRQKSLKSVAYQQRLDSIKTKDKAYGPMPGKTKPNRVQIPAPKTRPIGKPNSLGRK